MINSLIVISPCRDQPWPAVFLRGSNSLPLSLRCAVFVDRGLFHSTSKKKSIRLSIQWPVACLWAIHDLAKLTLVSINILDFIERYTFQANRLMSPLFGEGWLLPMCSVPSNESGVRLLKFGPKFRETHSFFLVEAKTLSVGFQAQVEVYSVKCPEKYLYVNIPNCLFIR